MAATVFTFKGRAYHGKPGLEYRPLEVQEDFGEWRPVKSQDGKQIANWLVKHGYRLAYRKTGNGDACDYQEWWATTELIGNAGQAGPADLRLLLAGKQVCESPEYNNQTDYERANAVCRKEVEQVGA